MDFCQTRHKCVSDVAKSSNLIKWRFGSTIQWQKWSVLFLSDKAGCGSQRFFISFQQNWLADHLGRKQTWLLKNAERLSVEILPGLLKTAVILQLDSSRSWYNLNRILNLGIFFMPIRNKWETFNIKLNKSFLRFNPDDKKMEIFCSEWKICNKNDKSWI